MKKTYISQQTPIECRPCPPDSEPDGGPARRDKAAGPAGGAVGRAAAHREGAHPAEAALPLQLQHRPRIPQEQEGELGLGNEVYIG